MDQPTDSIQDLVFQVVAELGFADPVATARRSWTGTGTSSPRKTYWAIIRSSLSFAA
jgi:hypothetical protein